MTDLTITDPAWAQHDRPHTEFASDLEFDADTAYADWWYRQHEDEPDTEPYYDDAESTWKDGFTDADQW